MMNLKLAHIPLKNIKGHPTRSLIIFLLAVAQAACVVAGAALAASSLDTLSVAEERLGADIIVYPFKASYSIDMDKLVMQGTPVSAYSSRAELANMSDCDGIAAVSCQIYVPGPADGPSWVIGFEPETDFAISPWIEEGASFKVPAGTALIGCAVAESNGSVNLYGRSWPVGAHLEKTGSILDTSVFLGPDDLQTAINDAIAGGMDGLEGLDAHSHYSAALVRVSNKADVESIANWLKVYVRKTKAVRSDEALTATASDISWQSTAIGALATAAWIVLLAALAVAQSMSMRERKAELYVWRASGASLKTITEVLRREAAALHAAGGIAGVVLAWAALAVSSPSALLPVLPAIGISIAAVALCVLAGLASATLAAKRTMKALDGQMLVAA